MGRKTDVVIGLVLIGLALFAIDFYTDGAISGAIVIEDIDAYFMDLVDQIDAGLSSDNESAMQEDLGQDTGETATINLTVPSNESGMTLTMEPVDEEPGNETEPPEEDVDVSGSTGTGASSATGSGSGSTGGGSPPQPPSQPPETPEPPAEPEDECTEENESVDCDDNNTCTLDVCSGDPAQCSNYVIVECIPADGCCPDGCSYENDTDCEAPEPPAEPPEDMHFSFAENYTIPNDWMDVYGNLTIGGEPAQIGDEVAAIDPDGIVCGIFRVKLEGRYGFVHVYKDDGGTPEDEGAEMDDVITFRVYDWSEDAELNATASVDVIWVGGRARVEADLTA